MKRRAFLAAGAALLAGPLPAGAQAKVPVVGFLWNDTVVAPPVISTFLGAMFQKGYVPGRSLRTDDRVREGNEARLADAAAVLVKNKVDVIVTYGGGATRAAAKATQSIPIAMIIGADPVAAGLVKSMTEPGGNVTGITTLSLGLVAKRIALLKDAVPGLSKLGLLVSATASAENLREAESAAKGLGLQVALGRVAEAKDIEAVVAALASQKVGALHVAGGSVLAAARERVVSAIAAQRLPAAYSSDRYVDAGGMLVYTPSLHKVFVRLAGYVERILRGARPAEMAIELNSDVDLAVNLRTARAIGVEVPTAVLQRADRVAQ